MRPKSPLARPCRVRTYCSAVVAVQGLPALVPGHVLGVVGEGLRDVDPDPAECVGQALEAVPVDHRHVVDMQAGEVLDRPYGEGRAAPREGGVDLRVRRRCRRGTSAPCTQLSRGIEMICADFRFAGMWTRMIVSLRWAPWVQVPSARSSATVWVSLPLSEPSTRMFSGLPLSEVSPGAVPGGGLIPALKCWMLPSSWLRYQTKPPAAADDQQQDDDQRGQRQVAAEEVALLAPPALSAWKTGCHLARPPPSFTALPDRRRTPVRRPSCRCEAGARRRDAVGRRARQGSAFVAHRQFSGAKVGHRVRLSVPTTSDEPKSTVALRRQPLADPSGFHDRA